MTILDVRFPSTDGMVVVRLKEALQSWAPVTIQPLLPASKTRRMVTARNDSGPQDGVMARNRYGFNVWADSRVDAEAMALDAMAGMRRVEGASTDQFTGPFEIPDDVPFVVGGKSLSHYYWACRVSVRAVNFSLIAEL